MTTRSRLLAGALAAVLLTTSLAACGGNDEPAAASADGLTTVRLASSPLGHLAPIYLAQEQGIFAKHGLKVEVDTETSDLTSVPAVLAGKVDFATGDLTTLIVARSKGLDVKAVVPASASTGKEGADYGALVVKGDSGITSAKQLEGKTVSVNILTNIAAAAAREAVRADGGDPTKVKLVEIPFPQAPAAVSTGRVDGAWVVEPFLSAAKAQGAVPVGWGFTDLAPDLTVSAWYAAGSYTSKNAKTVTAFRDAVREAYAYARDHEDEVRAKIPTFTEIKPEVAAKITLTGLRDEVSRQAAEKLAGYAQRDGLITTTPDLDELILK
ncbi:MULTISPECIES: ABC transporter substrate-binding protein [Micromonospora]|uniref:ABC transporter substrate-binding protein n=1 Tax=Micromonospora TaxID=1873 RepID=UPI00112BBDC1|nr:MULTISPECIES: ABC transporter substrate-binding protein [unclassified Micromonospora]MCK1806009.1 ABC transporter substrate-binding protein [Micromonospora sp. R42106]MCK1832706.1 ABC transporter substrate-binding protein [Micromonospora sp. R42003]MCK1844023.1 ABC transporter substrate-binding protein [Micromonospora sp. R42004]MCM1015443.1 ABC transporter substrate-binding protein [Micromonospora sp. XM-20-01]